MLHDLLTLGMLVFLQIVLGFDNLLYISIESGRVEASRQGFVRRLGIGIAIALRIVLLFAVLHAIEAFQAPFARLNLPGLAEADFNVHAAIVLAGGAFIIWTALKEILHLLSVDDLDGQERHAARRSVAGAVAWIAVMNVVFSFDSILSAIALTHVFWVMATAIVVSGVLMMLMADRVSDFIHRNRMVEVLGLFILFLVGVLLVSEGGELAGLRLLGHPVHSMEKSTFYFVLVVLVAVDAPQSRSQRKLEMQRSRTHGGGAS